MHKKYKAITIATMSKKENIAIDTLCILTSALNRSFRLRMIQIAHNRFETQMLPLRP